ncbi:MAG TPA: hypothetical protein VL574_06305 [Stellaceae bacterium]|nr:hypothetical protein [Stellaceae bacterium]
MDAADAARLLDLAGPAAWIGAPNLAAARRHALAARHPLHLLRHGLLSAAVLPGQHGPALLSLTCDHIETTSGRAPGPAEHLLASDQIFDPGLLHRARASMAALVKGRIGGPMGAVPTAMTGGPREILIAADRPLPPRADSRELPLASLEAMLADALKDHHPGQVALLLPVHRGLHAFAAKARELGCAVAQGPADLWPWVDESCHVLSLGGDAALLGLVLGRSVTAYAEGPVTGWGLTADRFEGTPRRPRNLEEVFAAICLVTTRYIDPFFGTETSFEATAELLATWRRIFEENAEIACVLGSSFWKRERLAQFFATPGCPTRFAKTPDEALQIAQDSEGRVAFWPLMSMLDFPERVRTAGVAYRRIEDGFIRSIGLGTNLMPPASLVADAQGIYFDPSGPSDLETILAEAQFDAPLRERAARLIRLQIERNITKYNLAETADDLTTPPGRRAILVPGQVEDDKSVLLGGAGITSNAELLERVRAANPEGFIVYKGHPDVEAGHRKGLVPARVLAKLADAVMPNASIVRLINWADEVHTLTSLSGFEALLRGKTVVTYGQPFYAGWGLTRDMAPPISRRGRRLTVEELVAATLILYPRYLDPVTGLPCGPEVLIDRIAHPELWPLSFLMRVRHVQGWVLRRLGLSGSVGKSFK